MERSSGILLHLTSLPGRLGIGDMGKEAFRFIDFLRESGQHLWQILPIGPAGYGNVPYQCSSAFAGNPLLISLEQLAADGFLTPGDLDAAPSFPENFVDFKAVTGFKIPLLHKAYQNFTLRSSTEQQEAFALFCRSQAKWLDTYALFTALKDAHQQKSWLAWEADIRRREPEALQQWSYRLQEQIQCYRFQQWQFFEQWKSLKKYGNDNQVKIIGDMPIFAAPDSADVWAHPEMFYLEESGRPSVVAGVPPDYFSRTGQLWGNPLYRWDAMKADGYRWWLDRFRSMFNMVDFIRIDHFRGFVNYWAIPGTDKTAEHGRWRPGPGADLFETVEKELGTLPIIAEDLGIITPDVEALRDRFNFPGMRVLQFAFNGNPKQNIHLPHRYERNCVVYTGTHDNTTTVGWFRGNDIGETTQVLPERRKETKQALRYLGTDGSAINWDFIRLAMMSVADTAIIPLQDVLGLGNEARMNTPGTITGNWRWRFAGDRLTDEIRVRLREMAETYGR